MNDFLLQHESKDIRTRNVRGFTLVELLVTISIFLILITLTAAMIRNTSQSQRVSVAASQVQAYLEGARARAFQKRSPVGIRFLLDKDDQTTVSSMVYLDTPSKEYGKLKFYPAEYIDDSFGPLTTGFLSTAPRSPNVIVFDEKTQANTGIPWRQLYDQHLLIPGVNIQIPAHTGFKYKVHYVDFDKNIVRSPSAIQINPGFLNVPPPVQSVDYVLELAATPIANAIPVELPKGTTIDLNNSIVPKDWIPTVWTSGSPMAVGYFVTHTNPSKNKKRRFFRVTSVSGGATTGGSEPDWDSIPTGGTFSENSNQVTYQATETLYLDLMFSSSGAVMDAISAQGVIRLLIAEREDTEQNLKIGNLLNNDTVSPAPRGDMRIISIYTHTGAIYVSQVDLTDSDNDKVADNPFRLAEEVEESK